MKSERLPKILLIGFIFALGIYVLTFSFIQQRRTAKGPWQVVFTTDNEATPGMLVTNAKLKVNQRIVFSGLKHSQANLVQPVLFDDPIKTNVPFGQIIFQDLTFLPGTVTINFSGHEVEMLPRVLIIDKKEYEWAAGNVIYINGPGKIEAILPKRK